MIIVEGPDGSGKDVLIETLKHQSFKLKALRGGVGGTESYANGNGLGDGLAGWAGNDPALLAYQKKIKAARGINVAFNRFHFSEYVYGPLLRGTSEVGLNDLEVMKTFLWYYRVPVILCLPSFEVTLENVRRPGRERPAYQTEGFLSDAYNGFKQIMPWATITYDFKKDPLAKEVRRLLGQQ